MSLFQARDWWSTVVGEEEEFDKGCLCVANIDNNSNHLDKIIVGSYHGILRIYNPHPTKGESGFKAEDLLVESKLNLPILQVEAGKFVSGTDSIQLAILHPRKLAVYSVSAVTGAVEHGNHYQVTAQYELKLQRTAYNMCYGPFGGVKARDFICVQSMDGTVSVFEQESFAFSRFLPNALLPGPIAYAEKTDSFITVSSSRNVESYKYQVLAVASDIKTKEETQLIKSGKRVVADWTLNIGEQALDVVVCYYQQAPPSIFVLGERNIFCLSDVGKLRFMMKMEYNPSCFLPYASISEGTINYLVGTHTNSMLVYQDTCLKWAARLQHTPVQLCIASFQDLKGIVISLGEQGHLECSYMGTDPAMMVTPTTEVREINYEEQDDEMRHLQRVIKEQQHKSNIMPNVSSDEDLQIITQVSNNLDEVSQASAVEVQDEEDSIPSITVKIQLKAKMAVQNVRLSVHVNLPLAVNHPTVEIPNVDSGSPHDVWISFFMRNNFLPADLSAQITANYQNAGGAPRVAMAKIQLPIKLIVKPCLPVKVAVHKVTIDTNKPPVNLNDIFADLLTENSNGQALGFQFYGGPVITVLASKSSQRYRLQCDVFEALWLLTNELITRLTSYYQRSSDFKCSFSGSLPMHDYFEVIEKHFELRKDGENFKEHLSQRATQFRTIQKRLLTRFKDKTPAPLSNLDTLLEGTYRQLNALGDHVDQNKQAQLMAGNNLSSATYLVNTLIKLWTDMTDGEFRILQACLSPNVNDHGDLGWEENVDGAITHLLRTCLAKNSKDQSINPTPLIMPKDTSKLQKHIALLCDRLSKGAKLSVELPPGLELDQTAEDSSKKDKHLKDKHKKKSPRASDDNDSTLPSPGVLGDAEVPTGSKFGEKKSPRAKMENGLPSLNGIANLPPLPSAGKLAPLAPLGKKGLNDLKSKERINHKVPELDDLGDGGHLESPGLSLANGEEIEL